MKVFYFMRAQRHLGNRVRNTLRVTTPPRGHAEPSDSMEGHGGPAAAGGGVAAARSAKALGSAQVMHRGAVAAVRPGKRRPSSAGAPSVSFSPNVGVG